MTGSAACHVRPAAHPLLLLYVMFFKEEHHTIKSITALQ